MFNINEFYSRREIQEVLGGGEVIFLPNKDDIVTCACLDPDLNICSNEGEVRILVGEGPLRRKAAKLLIDESNRSTPIRVFIKRGSKRYEYVGKFIVNTHTSDQDDINIHCDTLNLPHDRIMSILMKRVLD